MTSPILEVEKVFKSFGGLTALANIDITVTEGEIIGLIGPNGSGKTTLLNLITGALRCDRGTIRFRGKDITRVSRERRCVEGINRTFQSSRPFPKMTVLQNVMVARCYGRNPARSRRAAALESEILIDFMGLREKKDIPAHNLGSAESKRLELGRALAANPTLLLLDEPMAGLSQGEISSIIDLFLIDGSLRLV